MEEVVRRLGWQGARRGACGYGSCWENEAYTAGSGGWPYPRIAHYRSMSWDLRGCPPHTVVSVPHSNVHLVADDQGATVTSERTSKFSTVIEGKSQVFG